MRRPTSQASFVWTGMCTLRSHASTVTMVLSSMCSSKEARHRKCHISCLLQSDKGRVNGSNHNHESSAFTQVWRGDLLRHQSFVSLQGDIRPAVITMCSPFPPFYAGALPRLLAALQNAIQHLSPAITARIADPEPRGRSAANAAAAAAAASSDTAELCHYIDGLLALAASAQPPGSATPGAGNTVAADSAGGLQQLQQQPADHGQHFEARSSQSAGHGRAAAQPSAMPPSPPPLIADAFEPFVGMVKGLLSAATAATQPPAEAAAPPQAYSMSAAAPSASAELEQHAGGAVEDAATRQRAGADAAAALQLCLRGVTLARWQGGVPGPGNPASAASAAQPAAAAALPEAAVAALLAPTAAVSATRRQFGPGSAPAAAAERVYNMLLAYPAVATRSAAVGSVLSDLRHWTAQAAEPAATNAVLPPAAGSPTAVGGTGAADKQTAADMEAPDEADAASSPEDAAGGGKQEPGQQSGVGAAGSSAGEAAAGSSNGGSKQEPKALTPAQAAAQVRL